MKPQLLGITYTEFDNRVGPQLRFQYPPDVINKETFEDVSSYVIVGKHLSERIITVVIDNQRLFMNYSVLIDNAKYDRNTLHLAIGFILENNENIEIYESCLRKFARTLIALEIEKEFLFLDTDKSKLRELVASFYHQLIEKNEVYLYLDQANYLCLRLFSSNHHMMPLPLSDVDIPIFLVHDPSALSYLPWDISIQHLIPCIDGFSSIQKIAKEAAMDIECVKNCLRVLVYYKCLIISDVFQFSNCYTLTENNHSLLSDRSSLESIQSFAAFDRKKLPSISQILRFTFALMPHISIGEMLATRSELVLEGMDIRKLLAILQSYQVIRRIKKYPVSISNKNVLNVSDISLMPTFESQSKREKEEHLNSFNGVAHVDEILLAGKTNTANSTSDILKFSHVIFISK